MDKKKTENINIRRKQEEKVRTERERERNRAVYREKIEIIREKERRKKKERQQECKGIDEKLHEIYRNRYRKIYVMRRSLLPDVTTLSRDLCRRPILGASNHNYLFIFIAWNLSLLE